MRISDWSSDVCSSDLIVQALKKQGFRVSSDLRGEKITRKIREHSTQKVPYILVVGEKERDAATVAVRQRGGVDLGVMALADFTDRLQAELRSEERRVGKGWVRTGRSRWSTYH